MNKKYNFKDVFIHETSYVDETVEIGENTKIWHFSHVLNNCKIGNNCSFGQNVVVGPNVNIGNKVKIQNNVSVYKGVTLEDSVFCGPSCVFTNVHNPRSEIERKHEYRKTLVKRGATLGANCTIVCGITIGKFSFIGAGAVISKDVPDYALMVGVPGKQIGWMSEYGEKLDLPTAGNAVAKCKHTNKIYELQNNKITVKE
jgi:UDP-2-acetamido-3-amino-2,3-dideoxy-glucuronate N-acetyltransferase